MSDSTKKDIPALLSGTSGNDVIVGTNGNDSISAGAGNDTVDGGAGNDTIDGGAGNDTIDGGSGNDTIDGGSGNDTIDGGSGNDKIDGGSGNDVIDGGTGDDVISGGQGNDIVYGGEGNDRIDGGQGNDTLNGGAGDDKITGGQGNDIINGDDGNDIIYGGSGDDLIHGNRGNDVIYGDSGNDKLFGDDGNDIIYGGSGKDTIEGGTNTGTYAVVNNAIQIQFKGSNAGYDNSFGYYIKDSLGNPTTGKVIWSDLKEMSVNTTATLTGLNPSQIGYFIIPNGGNLNSSLVDNTNVNFVNVSGVWKVVLASNNKALIGQGANVYFDNSTLNVDSFGHSKALSNGEMGWEDLLNGGDKDFNDALFKISNNVNVVNVNGGDELWGGNRNGCGDNQIDTFVYRSGDSVHTIYDFEVRLDKLEIYGYLASQALYIASGNDTFVRLSSTDGILLKNVSLQDAPSQINFFPGGDTPATIGGDNQGAVREDNILIDTGTLTISDPDAGQAAFQTQSGTAGSYGTLSITSAGVWTYILNNGAANVQALKNGQTVNDIFNISSVDGTSHQITVVVTGTNDAPIAAAESYSTAEGGTLNITLPGVLGNDTDVDNDPLNAVLVSGPANGSLALNPNGSFTYTHNGGETLSDSFSYKANDGSADSAPITVSITISPVNDAPIAASGSVVGNEDSTLVINLFASDVDGLVASYKVNTLPTNGTLYKDSTLTQALVAGEAISSSVLYFKPALNFNGSVAFDYVATDNLNADSAPAHVNITVVSVNDAPTGASNTITINEDTPRTLLAADFGFSDLNDNPANTLNAVIISSLPLTGSLMLNGATVTLNQSISLADIDSNLLVFIPALNANGTGYSSFSFQVQDNGGINNGGVNTDQSPNTITFDVTAVNDAPVPNNVTASGSSSQVFSIVLTGSDVDGMISTFRIPVLPSNSNGILYKDAAATFALAVSAGENIAASGNSLTLYFKAIGGFTGTENINYLATDNNGVDSIATAQAIITVTSTPALFDNSDNIRDFNIINPADYNLSNGVMNARDGNDIVFLPENSNLNQWITGNYYNPALIFYGGLGDDIIYDQNTVFKRSFSDTIDGQQGSDTISGGYENDILSGGASVINGSYVDVDTAAYKYYAARYHLIDISGKNHEQVTLGTNTATIKEDSFSSAASGLIDNLNTNTYVSSANYSQFGTLQIKANGEWTYQLNNSSIYTDSLNTGDSIADVFVVFDTDNKSHLISININGTTDVAEISDVGTNYIHYEGRDIIAAFEILRFYNINYQIVKGSSFEDIMFASNNYQILYGLLGDDQLVDDQLSNTILNGGDGKDLLRAHGQNTLLIGAGDDDILFGNIDESSIAGFAYSVNAYSFTKSIVVVFDAPYSALSVEHVGNNAIYDEGKDALINTFNTFEFSETKYTSINKNILNDATAKANNELFLDFSENGNINTGSFRSVAMLGQLGNDLIIDKSTSASNNMLVGGEGNDTLVGNKIDTTAGFARNVGSYQVYQSGTDYFVKYVGNSGKYDEGRDLLLDIKQLNFSGIQYKTILDALNLVTANQDNQFVTEELSTLKRTYDTGGHYGVVLFGGQLSDTLTDTTNGRFNNLIGSIGDDTLIGNSVDTMASYAGALATFELIDDGFGIVLNQVGDYRSYDEGTDTLTGIMKYNFSGHAYDAAFKTAGIETFSDNQIVYNSVNKGKNNDTLFTYKLSGSASFNVALLGLKGNDSLSDRKITNPNDAIKILTNNSLIGGEGNDILKGNDLDTEAGYAFSISNYDITFNGQEITAIKHLGTTGGYDEGSDTLENIKYFNFAGREYEKVTSYNINFNSDFENIILVDYDNLNYIGLVGNYSNIAVLGGAGDDTINFGSTFANRLNKNIAVGGQGDDTIIGNFSDFAAGYMFNIANYSLVKNGSQLIVEQVNNIGIYNEGKDTLTKVDQLIFGPAQYSAFVSSSAQSLAQSDNIIIIGEDTNNTLSTNFRNYVALYGGKGNDTLIDSNTSTDHNVLIGGLGNDSLDGNNIDTTAGYAFSPENYLFTDLGLGNIRIEMIGSGKYLYNEGIDTLSEIKKYYFANMEYKNILFSSQLGYEYANSNNSILVSGANNLSTNHFTGVVLYGTSFGQTLSDNYVDSKNSTLYGAGGNDTLIGNNIDTAAAYSYLISAYQLNYSSTVNNVQFIDTGINTTLNEGLDSLSRIKEFHFAGRQYTSYVVNNTGATEDDQIVFNTVNSSSILDVNKHSNIVLWGAEESDTLLNTDSTNIDNVLVGGAGNDILMGNSTDTTAGYAYSIINYDIKHDNNEIKSIEHVYNYLTLNEGLDTVSGIKQLAFNKESFTSIKFGLSADQDNQLVLDNNNASSLMVSSNLKHTVLMGLDGNDTLIGSYTLSSNEQVMNTLLIGGEGNDILRDQYQTGAVGGFRFNIASYLFNQTFTPSTLSTDLTKLTPPPLLTFDSITHIGTNHSYNEGTDTIQGVTWFNFGGSLYSSIEQNFKPFIIPPNIDLFYIGDNFINFKNDQIFIDRLNNNMNLSVQNKSHGAILGLDGNDTIEDSLFSRNNILVGGEGNDTIIGNTIDTTAGFAYNPGMYSFVNNGQDVVVSQINKKTKKQHNIMKEQTH